MYDAYHLPFPTAKAALSFVWGENDGESFTNSLNAVDTEVVRWKIRTANVDINLLQDDHDLYTCVYKEGHWSAVKTEIHRPRFLVVRNNP